MSYQIVLDLRQRKVMQHQVSIAFDGIDTDTPLNEKLCAKYTKSFAYYTVKDRLPVTLTKVINELVTSKVELLKDNEESSEEDLKTVIGKISKLKNELVTNKCLIKLCSDGNDVNEWNDYLDSQNTSDNEIPCWYYSPWLYVECYMYRRLWEIFENSQTLKKVDPFTRQKEEAFEVAIPEVKIVGKATLNAVAQLETSLDNLKNIFEEFLKLSLWSNRCDLSLTNGAQMSEEDCNLHNVNALDSFLLSDDSEQVYELLSKHPNGIVDFVNDNASYEVFCDFCLCDVLCTSSLASKIRFHMKKMPWFVSDTMKKDIHWLFDRLDKEGLDKLTSRWRHYFENDTWSMSDEKYWTLPFDYSDMKTRDESLYNSLGESILVIFKGDLNYRKLLGDINWNHCEKFDAVLRNFKPTSVLALRTVKADLICGLSHDKSETLPEKDKSWMRTGEYAVIQFSKYS